jgi:ATP-binding cassette subfamily B protein
MESVLPELRAADWEVGIRRRAQTGVLGVFAELPGMVREAMGISWRADRTCTLVVMIVTLVAGVMSTFGLLSTQRVLVQLFSGAPTADRVRAALPALALLAGVTMVRGALGIVMGSAQNGLTPRVVQTAERRLIEATSLGELAAFDQDAFSDDMERAHRGPDSAATLVQESENVFAGLVNLLAVAVAIIVINPLLLFALLVATVPNGYAALRSGHLRYEEFVAGRCVGAGCGFSSGRWPSGTRPVRSRRVRRFCSSGRRCWPAVIWRSWRCLSGTAPPIRPAPTQQRRTPR